MFQMLYYNYHIDMEESHSLSESRRVRQDLSPRLARLVYLILFWISSIFSCAQVGLSSVMELEFLLKFYIMIIIITSSSLLCFWAPDF